MDFKSLKLETFVGEYEYSDILEYVIGKSFIFIRREKETLSFKKDIVIKALRQYKGNWFPINLKR